MADCKPMFTEYYNLGINNTKIQKIEFAKNDDEIQWKELRKQGVGGSDAAAAMGMSKYTSPLKLWKTKKGLINEDLSGNKFVRKGKDLEEIVFRNYVKPYMLAKGYECEKPDIMFVNTNYPWLRANIDGIAMPCVRTQNPEDNIIIEIKVVSKWGESNWYGDEYCGVPKEYYAQVQHYMTVLGARKAIICAMFDDSWEMHYFEVGYDTSFAMKLIAETEKFWRMYVEMDIAPKPIPSMDKETFVKSATETPVSFSTVTGTKDSEFDGLCEKYLNLKQAIEEDKKTLTELLDKIYEKNLSGVSSEVFEVKDSVSERTTFDTKSFKAVYPDLYTEYSKKSQAVTHKVERK